MSQISTLHILNKPPGHGRARLCLEAVGPDDTLLLTENGVLAASQPDGPGCERWLALGPDLEARAIAGLVDQARIVSFDDMVTLTASAGRVISW
jgi:tRNA 2-thiouridine synthesizing protein B